MLDFILSVAFTVLIVTILKLFTAFKVEKFPAIVVNYWVCLLVGMATSGVVPQLSETLGKSWFPHALGLGFLFITGFYVIGLSLQYLGMAISSVVQKMSLVISVPFAILYFGESSNLLKISAIGLALLSVICINIPPKTETNPAATNVQNQPKPAWVWFLPIYLLGSSGAIECLLQMAQADIGANNEENAAFTMISFALAAAMGSVFLIGALIGKKSSLSPKTLLAGVILGIPNYFSIFFLIRSFSWLDKSVVLPINNISIVILTFLIGVIFFKESLSKLNLAGIGLAVAAIVLLSI